VTGERDTPWWYSGAEGDDHDEHPISDPPADDPQAPRAEGSDDASASPGMDWMGMVSGAVRMVDWATSAFLEPHGEHAVPREHPDCLVCRTLALMGDQAGMAPSAESPVPADQPEPAEPIRWLPIREARH